jgi:hypothetical protein
MRRKEKVIFFVCFCPLSKFLVFSLLDTLKDKQRGNAGGKDKPKVVKTAPRVPVIGGKTKIVRKTRPGSARSGVVKTAAPHGVVQPGKVNIGRAAPRIRNPTEAASPKMTITVSNKKKNGNNASPRVTISPRTTTPSSGTRGGGQTNLQKSVETAKSIVANQRHPKHNDVKILLDSYHKKFITDSRFIELLKNLLF